MPFQSNHDFCQFTVQSIDESLILVQGTSIFLFEAVIRSLTNGKTGLYCLQPALQLLFPDISLSQVAINRILIDPCLRVSL